LTHRPAHIVVPIGHVTAPHAPLLHACPIGHALPQAPQLAESTSKLVQRSPQRIEPGGQSAGRASGLLSGSDSASEREPSMPDEPSVLASRRVTSVGTSASGVEGVLHAAIVRASAGAKSSA
jgi:hypothetical protein